MITCLEWAEAYQLAKIPMTDISSLESHDGMMNRDPAALSRNLWGYLNLALAGSKHATAFNAVTKLNGFEAWRKIVVPMRPRSDAKRQELHSSVHSPPRARDLNHVIKDLDAWEKSVDSFEKCGGTITEKDRITIALKKLPLGCSHSLVMALRTASTYEELKLMLQDQVTFLQDFGTAKQGAANVVEMWAEHPEGPAEEGIEIDLSGCNEEQAEQILYAAKAAGVNVKNKFVPKFGGRPRGALGAPRAPTPPRTGVRAAKCGNCGGEHETRACDKPLLAEDKRACFNCGETGHQARNCKLPDRRKKAGINMVGAYQQQQSPQGSPPQGTRMARVDLGVMMDEEGFEKVQRRRADDFRLSEALTCTKMSQRERKQLIHQGHVDKSLFACLAEAEEDDDDDGEEFNWIPEGDASDSDDELNLDMMFSPGLKGDIVKDDIVEDDSRPPPASGEGNADGIRLEHFKDIAPAAPVPWKKSPARSLEPASPVVVTQDAPEGEEFLRENHLKGMDRGESKPNTLRETSLPTALEETAIKVMKEFSSIVQDELSARCFESRLLPVQPVGSTESWLSGTDDGSRTGQGKDQHAIGHPSTPKPLKDPIARKFGI